MNTKYLLITSILYALLVTGCYDDESKNRIVFNDSTEAVADSIYRMNALLDQLPDTSVVSYIFDEHENFYVNGKNIGKLDKIDDGRSSLFVNFSSSELATFKSLVLFLKHNYITSVLLHKSSDYYLYGYRSKYSEAVSQQRRIFLKEEKKSSETLFGVYKEVTRNGNLVLIADYQTTL